MLLCLFLGYSETWDTLLILRGTKVIYLDYVGTLRPSKSYGKYGYKFGIWTLIYGLWTSSMDDSGLPTRPLSIIKTLKTFL